MSQKRTRTIYVTDLEYEYLKKQLEILRTSASLAYENRVKENVKKDWRRPDSTEERRQSRAPQGDSHE